MDFLQPPWTQTEKGETRRVGFEIEFGGLGLEEVAQIIVQLHGGSIQRVHTFSYRIVDTRFGDFVVESDSRFLSQKKYDQYLIKMGLAPDSVLTDNVEKFLEKFAGSLLPFEIAMPPIAMDRLQAAEQIREALYRHSALGVSSSLFAAFGMQINAEVPNFKVETILSYLRAFFLLYDWLVEESEIAIARKIAPYIHPFMNEYVSHVLRPSYRPDLDQLMRDYLRTNSTRNRPLDLLPLFAYLNKDLVFRYPVERDLIKPRPTFHYRLPNSEIDRPDWSFAKEWNKWIQIEKLAADPVRIEKMSQDYMRIHEQKTFVKSPWILKTREWIDAMA